MPTPSMITKRGELVLSCYWDSGGPGAGAGVEQVFCLEGCYAVASEDDGLLGPFDSLVQAIEETDVLSISDASERIDCESLSVAQIIGLLRMYCNGDEPVLEINGNTCRFDAEASAYRKSIDR